MSDIAHVWMLWTDWTDYLDFPSCTSKSCGPMTWNLLSSLVSHKTLMCTCTSRHRRSLLLEDIWMLKWDHAVEVHQNLIFDFVSMIAMNSLAFSVFCMECVLSGCMIAPTWQLIYMWGLIAPHHYWAYQSPGCSITNQAHAGQHSIHVQDTPW